MFTPFSLHVLIAQGFVGKLFAIVSGEEPFPALQESTITTDTFFRIGYSRTF